MMLYTSKQGPSNALNIVIYRNQLQDVQWQARWFIYWCPAKLRSFGSLSMLSDSDRIINIAPYSVNEFLFYFILFNWGWMVAICLQNLPEQLPCVELSAVWCPRNTRLKRSWWDDQDTWKEAGHQCFLTHRGCFPFRLFHLQRTG